MNRYLRPGALAGPGWVPSIAAGSEASPGQQWTPARPFPQHNEPVCHPGGRDHTGHKHFRQTPVTALQ